MGQTLTHGVYLPDEGERNCYAGLAANWQILDTSVGTIAEHTSALAGKAPLVHTHSKADITDFPALATVATSGSYTDLSNIPASFTPASHTHGNITNDGKVGTTANKPLITGTDGVVQAGAFGNSANTFCEGNDARLSDARTPVAHTHVTADVTDFPDMTLYPYKLAYTTNGGNFPYINLADSDHIALGFNGITDTGIYKVRATADVPGTPNALTMDGILVVFNSDGTANVSSHRRCQQIFYQNSTTPKIFKRIGVFNITSQTWNWDTYKWVEYANTGRDFIPNETNSLNIGSSSYQWNNLYAKNYFYNGTAWGLDKVNVWSAKNTYSADCIVYNSDNSGSVATLRLRNSKAEVLSTGNTASDQSITFRDKNDVAFCHVRGAVQSTSVAVKIGAYAKDSSNNTVNTELQILAFINGNKAIFPSTTEAYDLGISSYKWKTLNGIDPGALSLPNIYDSYDVVTTNWSTTYNQPNNLKINGADPSYPGWLFIRLDNCTQENDFLIVRYYHVNAANLTFFGSFIPTASSYVLAVPIQAGITIKVWVSKIPTYCKYYACLGTIK